jgi:hypothetical protein
LLLHSDVASKGCEFNCQEVLVFGVAPSSAILLSKLHMYVDHLSPPLLSPCLSSSCPLLRQWYWSTGEVAQGDS